MLLAGFIVLQLMDALTTIAFLQQGVTEANPFIRLLLGWSAHAGLALAGPKIFAIALGVYAWRSGRHRLLRRMNTVFALFVAWNVAVILTQAV
jgi:hypothetical protein